MFWIFFCAFSVCFFFWHGKKNKQKNAKQRKTSTMKLYKKFFFPFSEKFTFYVYRLYTLKIIIDDLTKKALFRLSNYFHYFFLCQFGTNYLRKKNLLSKYHDNNFHPKSFFFFNILAKFLSLNTFLSAPKNLDSKSFYFFM